MGKHFGELATIRGIIYYKLSPHEQKPFANAITKGLPNILTRTRATIIYWLPPFIVGYLVYSMSEAQHRANGRKNPADYINEVDPNPPPPPARAKKCPPKDDE